MAHAEQSSYSFMTLSEWMTKRGDNLEEVVILLCRIFGIDDVEAALSYIEEEIDHQGHFLLVVDEDGIAAVAGWRWTKKMNHIAAYAGVHPFSRDPYIREELIAEIITRLEKERIISDRVTMKHLLIQYSPYDRLMGPACLSLKGQRHPERNTYFKRHLGTRWTLRSMMFFFRTGPTPA